MMCYVQTSSGASSSQMAEMNRGDELCKCSSNVSGMGYTKNSVLVILCMCVCVLCACVRACVCVK